MCNSLDCFIIFFAVTVDVSRPQDAFCGPCESRQEYNKPEYWCTACEEGLCSDCNKHHKAMKPLRNHKVVAYDKLKDLLEMMNPKSTLCKVHEFTLELYCPNHEIPCCLKCTDVSHSRCFGMKPLSSFAATFRRSAALHVKEKQLELSLDNIEKHMNDRVDRKLSIKTVMLCDQKRNFKFL